MLNAISTRLRPSSQPPSTASSGVSAGSPSSSGQSSPEPPPAPPSHRHKQHLIRRVLQAPLGGNNQQGVSGASKAKPQTRAEHRDAQKAAAAAAAAAAAMHNSNSVKDLVSSLCPLARSLFCLFVRLFVPSSSRPSMSSFLTPFVHPSVSPFPRLF